MLAAVAAATACVAIPAPTPAADERYASELAEQVNAYRASRGLAALRGDAGLGRLAREHSERMARTGRMSHDGFETRFAASGFRLCVENVGFNAATPAVQLAGWQRSPVHDRNLRDARPTAMGVARSGRYVTFIACG